MPDLKEGRRGEGGGRRERKEKKQAGRLILLLRSVICISSEPSAWILALVLFSSEGAVSENMISVEGPLPG